MPHLPPRACRHHHLPHLAYLWKKHHQEAMALTLRAIKDAKVEWDGVDPQIVDVELRWCLNVKKNNAYFTDGRRFVTYHRTGSMPCF